MPSEFELGDDGEFAEAVDTHYGVYSARRKTWAWRLWLSLGVFAMLLVASIILLRLS